MLHCSSDDGKSSNGGKWAFAIEASVVRVFVSNRFGVEEDVLSRPGAVGGGH